MTDHLKSSNKQAEEVQSQPNQPAPVDEARLRNQASNIIYTVFGAVNTSYKPEREIARQLTELETLITKALQVAHASATALPADVKRLAEKAAERIDRYLDYDAVAMATCADGKTSKQFIASIIESVLTDYHDDLQEVIEDGKRLVRELDVIWNGDGAAKQASLCDMVGQIQAELPKLRANYKVKEEG